MNKKEPKIVLEHLIKEKYADAKAVFWAGSVTTGTFTSKSDLDIVVIYDRLPSAYRQAFIYEDWQIDAFVHDMQTLKYFFEVIDKSIAMPALPNMVISGILITEPCDISKSAVKMARDVIADGPDRLSQEELDRMRFFITDLLDDITATSKRAEQIAAACRLYEELSTFYFRAQNEWLAKGKSILKLMKEHDYQLACDYRDAFNELFKHGHANELETLVQRILEPYGGLLWDGYTSYAPEDWRI